MARGARSSFRRGSPAPSVASAVGATGGGATCARAEDPLQTTNEDAATTSTVRFISPNLSTRAEGIAATAGASKHPHRNGDRRPHAPSGRSIPTTRIQRVGPRSYRWTRNGPRATPSRSSTSTYRDGSSSGAPPSFERDGSAVHTRSLSTVTATASGRDGGQPA